MLRSIRLCLISVVLLLSTQSLAGGFYSGNDFVDWCLDESQGKKGRCYGFIMGVVDTALVIDAVREEPVLCMQGATELNMIQMSFEYANDHPELLEGSAAGLVFAAVNETYGCDWPSEASSS